MRKKALYPLIFFFTVPIVFLSVGSCKTQKNESSSNDSTESFLIHLKDKYTISDLEMLNGYDIKSAKRTSRSQNLWLIELTMEPTQKEALIIALGELDQVISVKPPSSEGSYNFTNSDKKKSKPNN